MLGGAGGIRTLDTAFQPYNGLANRRLQPLGHSSVRAFSLKAKASASRDFDAEGGSFAQEPGPAQAVPADGLLAAVIVVRVRRRAIKAQIGLRSPAGRPARRTIIIGSPIGLDHGRRLRALIGG